MRNLKRALSLTLASVMLLGMMVVGSSAASYPDVDENDNIEAIEVLQAVKVMVGDDNGNFGPDDQVNRAQMAVVMALLLDLDYDYYKGSDPGFWDVPSWAAPYVAACYANGIVSGYGNGQYGSGDPVTAVQAASMMMRALGYFKYQSDYANGFELSTVTQASKIELFKGVNAASNTTALTRNQVAKMALNALQTPIVEPDDNTLNITTSAGNATTTVTGGRVNYTVVSSTQSFAKAIDDTEYQSNDLAGRGGCTVELGEKLYSGELKLREYDTDDFGRPARTWEYQGKDIGTYVKKEQIKESYTAKVTGKDLYDLLGKGIVDDPQYDFFIYVDGEDRYNETDGVNGVSNVFNKSQMNKNNKAAVGGTGTGTLTQVFLDGDRHEVTIAVINTYLARAKADYNEKRDDVSFNVYAIKKGTANSADYYWKALDRTNDQKETMTVSGEDFNVANVKENDTFLVTVANGEIQTMVEPEIIAAATLDSFKQNDNVVADGTTYKYTTTAQYDVEVLDDYTGDSSYGVNLKDKHYNIYLDLYGNLIGIDLVENADNYVFITGVDSKASNLSAKQYDANAIFLDGTMKTITFDNEKSTIDLSGDNALLNTWCTYTVSGSNEIYTLKEVQNPAPAATTIDGTAVGAGDSLVGLKNGSSKAVKVGQYYDKMNDDLNGDAGVYSETNEINVKRVSLRGAVGDSRGEYKYVYGNDATVYLNVEVKGIYTSGSNGAPRGVISKVTGVTTGIKNAGLEVMTEDQAAAQAQRKSASRSVTPAYPTNGEPGTEKVAYGAYVLYNDKGYVIAAVTVADDSAASENLVYVNSSAVEKESYNSSADEWTWTRKVVHNGEEITLTEVGDSISILKGLKQHNWYVVSYNAEGEVISANHALDELASKTTTQYCNNIANLEGKINTAGTNTVLYERSECNGLLGTTCPDYTGVAHTALSYHNDYGPKLENNTFFDITTATTGFYVNDDVKVVFIQMVKNVWETEFKQGKTDLQNVISSLIKDENDADGDYYYEVSAILNNGRADVVVIRDLHTHGDSGTSTVKPSTNTDLIVDTTTKTDVKVKYTGDDAPATEEAVKAVREKLEEDGYTVDKIDFVAQGERGTGPDNPATDQYEFTVSKSGVPMGKFIYKDGDPSSKIQEITVKVNGSDVRIAANTSTTAAIATAAGVTDAGSYVKIYDKSTDTTAMTAAGAFTPGEGDTFDFGYYKVTASTAEIANCGNISNSATVTVTAPVKNAADGSDKYEQYVKANNMTINFTLKLGDATTGGVDVKNGADIVGTIPSGAAKNSTHDVTVSLTAAQVKTDPTVTLTVADRTSADITVNGVTKTFAAGVTWDKIYTDFNIARGAEGKWAKVTKTGSPDDWANLSNAPTLVDGATYEFGYYKVSMDGTSVDATAVSDLDGSATSAVLTDKDGNGNVYVKANGTVSVTVTAKAASTKTVAENTLKVAVADTATSGFTVAPNSATATTHGEIGDTTSVTFTVTVTLGGYDDATKDVVLKLTLTV